MEFEVLDEILADEPKYRIRDEDGNILFDKITIEMITEILQAGTPMNKTLFDIVCPSGLICMWSGTTVPNGWYLCNGENGTPDLRDRFIVGAGNEYAIGDVGGEKEVTLTIDQMPSHRHSYTQVTDLSYTTTRGAGTNNEHSSSTGYTGYNGEDQPHENRPPYYALAYIMKA